MRLVWDPPTQPLSPDELARILPIKTGQVYRAADIREAIERLYATGRYRDIQVDASPSGAGVALTFITKNSWFVGHVAATGDLSDHPSTGQIVNASRFQLGDPFDETQIPAAVENIRKLLVQNGFFVPTVEPRVQYDSVHQEANLTFAIRTGGRAHYEKPEIIGDTTVLSADQIAKATGWRRFLIPGYRGITQSGTRKGIDKIRLKYENAHRLLATVVLNGIEPDENNRKGKPSIEVNPGPPVTITTPGVKVSKSALRDNIPVFEEHTVDADLLAEGRTNLRDYFQDQGYSDVGVEYKENTVANGATEIAYEIELGKRHTFVYLGIGGNKYFDEKTIRERLLLLPKSFAFRRGRYSEALLKRDITTIEDLYESNGFRDAKVTSRLADDYRGKTGDLAVFLTIQEGPQYLVETLDVEGAKKVDMTRMRRALNSQPGQVFSEFNVAADRETIIREYGRNGFPDATFDWTAKPGTKPHTLALKFTIGEGQQQFVRQVVTQGLHTTKQSLVDKQITDLDPGAPLSPEAMADTQRKLDDLGIFSRVNTAIQNPDGDEASKYVVYDLDEARRYSLTTGFGLQFARIGGSNAITDLSEPGGAPGVVPRVSVAVSRLNLFGIGQTLTLQGVLSSLQKRALLTYAVPKIFDTKLDTTFSLLYDDTFNVRTFLSKREEASIKLTQHVTKPITIFYNFSYRHVGVSDLKINPLLLPQLAQSVRVGIAEINLIQDRRDDPLDPHKGVYNTLNVGLATKYFGSQTSFARILGRNATYYRLGEKVVLARETQVGMQPAFAIPANSEPGDPIPLAERFFGGGGNTQRGFPENQAGPRDTITGFPLGGSALLFNNTELRFPLYGANINGVLFEDAGNIYSSLGAISFRTDQRNPSDFDYMVHAAGFGIRYRTPIGPLRLDLAYSINPPKYSGFPGNYSQLVQCSAANTCQAQALAISHFQFFFSIGQAF